MEDNQDDRDAESASSDSFIDDSDEDKPTICDENDELHVEANLTEEEIEELIAEFFEAESKAAEAQESLEEESLRKVEDDVRAELAQTLQGDDLDKAVSDEMESYREEWETVLDEHETEISHLLEQLDGAGIDLPSLFKCIEGHAPNESSTEAWKKRIHWIGGKATSDVAEFVSDAENYLKIHRPVRKKHGKVLEEGASGYLEKKLAVDDTVDASQRTSVDWSSFNKLLSGNSSEDRPSFGNKLWASVYLASTPQQAAELGLDFPGMDEVEEIGDIEGDSSHPFMADAVENEREPVLSEEQKKNFRKVKEEEDASLDKKLQLRLKHRRKRNINKQEAIWRGVSTADRLTDGSSNASGYDGKLASGSSEDDGPYIKTVDNCNVESFVGLNKSAPLSNGTVDTVSNNGVPDDSRGFKRFNDDDRSNIDVKKSRVIIVDSDNEDHVALDKESPVYPIPDMMGLSELKRDGDGSIPADHDPQKTVKAFHCTSCGIESAEVHSHPLLRVVICQDCKCLVEQKMHSKDLGSMEGYCAWCGGTQNLLTCMSCKTLFCGTCIKRNLGEGRLLQIQQSSWICCCCSPDMLQKLTSLLVNPIESKSLTTSSSDSDSGTSVTEIKFRASSKRKRKKKIRRILDDAELGEETKKKIAIEKERQERLKSLEAQFSRKAMPVDSNSFNCNYSEGASAEVLGDASTGYIVNVVREKGEEAVRIPPSLSRKLKPHQISGIRFMWENIIQSVTKVKSGDKGLGCILAHTMGLGKTLQVIAFLYSAMRSVDLGLGTALIVTPVSVLHNWRKEFLKWGPSELKPLRLFMLEDVSRERRAELLAKWKRKGGIFLMSYAAFRNLSFGKHVKDRQIASNMSLALQDGPDILVCDEAHMIKNTRADTTQALKQVKCQRRIALTGSPLQNNLMEYYCMVDFVREGFLGSSHEFRNRFQNPIENGQHTNSTSEDVKIMNQSSHILYEQLKGFVQRVDMNVMKDDLPPKTVFVIAVKLAPLQSKLYKRFLDVHGFRNVQVSSEKIQKRSFFAGYQALAQIWNHPGILQLKKPNKDYGKPEDADDNIFPYDSFSDENMDCNMVTEKQQTTRELLQGKHGTSFIRENWWKDLLQENTYKEIGYSGKMVLLLDIITMSSDVGDKTLVFSQSISTLDLVEYHLSKLTRCGKTGKFWKKGKDWYRLDGRTEALARQKLVEKFNDPSNKRVKCTLISTRAGSLGINLYAANRVVIVDGSWNPTYDLQAIYRAWRYGQTKPVFAYRLMAHGTMEEKIYKRQVTKEGLAARVVDRQQIYRTISKEEMLHLFDFGDDESSECYSEDGLENGDSRLPNGNVSSDKLMETLLNRHCPRWVVNYHEHETLLQENEDEKLSKEEQDMAWEVFRRRLEWEEAHRLNPENPAPTPNPWEEVKRGNLENATPKPPPPPPAVVPQRIVPTTVMKSPMPARDRSRDRMVQRKCTNTAHLMTLQIQGTKAGCATICGECAKEIRWEDFERKNRA